MKRLSTLLTTAVMLAALAVPASALEYDFTGPDSGTFARPTCEEITYVTTAPAPNHDVSKNVALVPPAFGSPTSYLPISGERLTPNLAQTSGRYVVENVSGGVTLAPPVAVPMVSIGTMMSYTQAFTAATSDLYYSGGYLGTLSAPAIDLYVKVYQGTDSAALAKGAGHFTTTSVWDGNVAIAGHNRGVNNHFGKIHTLEAGDKLTYTTQLGTRTYEVYSVSKVSVDDTSILDATGGNLLTLVTCVMDQPAYRWCVKAVEVK